MKHNYRELLAYVGWASGDVTVELIKLTRNGHSYYFQGKRWRRELSMFGGDVCITESGEKLKISPLNRNLIVDWVQLEDVIVSNSALERFEKWNESHSD